MPTVDKLCQRVSASVRQVHMYIWSAKCVSGQFSNSLLGKVKHSNVRYIMLLNYIRFLFLYRRTTNGQHSLHVAL